MTIKHKQIREYVPRKIKKEIENIQESKKIPEDIWKSIKKTAEIEKEMKKL